MGATRRSALSLTSDSGREWPMPGVQRALRLRQGIRHARISEDMCQLQHLREAKKILVTQQVEFLSGVRRTSCLLPDDTGCGSERRCATGVFRTFPAVSATTPKHGCCSEIQPKAAVTFMYTRAWFSSRATPKSCRHRAPQPRRRTTARPHPRGRPTCSSPTPTRSGRR
jgi:hypothetical protein